MENFSAKDMVAIIKAGSEAKATRIVMPGLQIDYQCEQVTPQLTQVSPKTSIEPEKLERVPLTLENISTEELMYIDPVAYEERLAMEG